MQKGEPSRPPWSADELTTRLENERSLGRVNHGGLLHTPPGRVISPYVGSESAAVIGLRSSVRYR